MVENIVRKTVKDMTRPKYQNETIFGMFTALCVDTIDPWKQNRVRFFSPYFNKPDTPVKSLPFASPISVFGGFDDSGVNWVPPAGATLCLVFEHGNRAAPYYIGTTWHRDRGPDGEHNWGFNIEEYYNIHEGNRKGNNLLRGDEGDGSDNLPPWNTENYNGIDIDSIEQFDNDPEAQRKITNPHICGFKTLEKHAIKMVDGDYKCNNRWKRFEIISSCGGHMIFKDDHLHPAGQWCHPKCGCGGGDVSSCVSSSGVPEEIPDCGKGTRKNKCANPYFKAKNECRPYKGPGTPQNNKCELEQSGIQILSISGHTWLMDDSVEEPDGLPTWQKSTESFSFGCSDVFKGKIEIISATGHKLSFNDKESKKKVRGEENGIKLLTASGNKIDLNDHTISCPCDGESGDPSAGNQRGIHIQSTSNHTLDMVDDGNKQCSPCRKEGGTPKAEAKRAFVRLRSGYGTSITFSDGSSQEEVRDQNLLIYVPQKGQKGAGNEERGPHMMKFQAVPSGPGQVFLRAGGDYIVSVHDTHWTIVGDKEKNPTSQITQISKDCITETQGVNFNKARTHIFKADDIIQLLAGGDCSAVGGGECQACRFPILLWTPKGITISDRVFASCSGSAQTASVFGLKPFMGDQEFSNACGGPSGQKTPIPNVPSAPAIPPAIP